MKGMAKPIRFTIVWGLFSGFVYLPMSLFLNSIIPWPLGDRLLFWALCAGYGILLTGWAFKPLASAAMPFFLLLFAAFFIQSTTIYLFAALGLLSWLRSGRCFNRAPVAKRFATEIGLGLSAGLAASAVLPAATLAGALGIWLFFLVQALYFVVFEYPGKRPDSVEVDPFERARMAAEQILSH